MAFDMSSLAAPLVSGGSDLIGSMYSASHNRKAAKNQMAFQEHMSSTSYQRAVEDLKKAGLSPMLAYSQGGASSPSGASWSVESPAKNAVSSAMSAIRTEAELANIQADTRKKNADATIVEKNVPIANLINEVTSKAINSARSFKDNFVKGFREFSKINKQTPAWAPKGK